MENLFSKNLDTPSIIFLEVNMPVMPRFDFLKAYNPYGQGKGKIKIVMVSSSNHRWTSKEQKTKELVIFLKPVDEKMLPKFFLHDTED